MEGTDLACRSLVVSSILMLGRGLSVPAQSLPSFPWCLCITINFKAFWDSRTGQLFDSNSAAAGIEGKLKANTIPSQDFLPRFLHLQDPALTIFVFQLLGKIAPFPPGLGQLSEEGIKVLITVISLFFLFWQPDGSTLPWDCFFFFNL